MAYSKSTNRDNISTMAEQMGQTHIENHTGHIQVRVKKATEVKLDEEWGVYPMQSNPRGLALILNYENFPDSKDKRVGSDKDVLHLEELCKQLGFKVETRKDLHRHNTLLVLEKIIKNPLNQTTDMLMVFIMSHGKDKDKVICSDGICIEYEEILCKLTSVELHGKPKFIVFETCRGDKIDEGITSNIMFDSNQTEQYENPGKVSTWQDMLIAYSSVNGYVSIRSPNGSWFIDTLVRVFMNNAYNKDLVLLLRDVGTEMEKIPHQYKQSMEYTVRNFKKKLYFNPGLNNKDNSENYTNVTSKKKTDKLETDVKYPNLTQTDHEKNIHTPALTNTVNNAIKTVNLDTRVMNPDYDTKKNSHKSTLTNTNYNLETSVSTPKTDNKSKNNIHTPPLTRTNYILENSSYKVEKIETGSCVECLQYDEEKIVVGLGNGEIKIYNKVTLKLEHCIKAHSKGVTCLQFNKNMLLSGSNDKTVKIYSNVNYQLLNTLKLDNYVVCLKSNFKDMLVTGTRTQLSVWKLNSHRDIEKTKVLHSGNEYSCVDFDDTHIVNGCDEDIQVWSTRSLKILTKMIWHTHIVRSLQIYKELIVSGSLDETIRIWNIHTGSCIRTLEGHTFWISTVRFDTQRIISAAWDKTIRIWKYKEALDPNIASDALCSRTFNEHTSDVNCLQFDDTQIVSGSSDDTILIHTFQTSE